MHTFKLGDIVRITEERLAYEVKTQQESPNTDGNLFKVITKLSSEDYHEEESEDDISDYDDNWNYENIVRIENLENGLISNYHCDFLELDPEFNREKKIKIILEE